MFFSGNILKSPIRCPECKAAVQYYGEINPTTTDEDCVFSRDLSQHDEDFNIISSGYYELKDISYQCPSCEKIELKFFVCGMWD
jgi:phage FluMu protein Com